MVWMASAVKFGIRSHVNWKYSKTHLCISAWFLLVTSVEVGGRGNLLMHFTVLSSGGFGEIKLDFFFFYMS